MKRILYLALVLVMTVMMTAGCGGAGSSSSEAADQQQEETVSVDSLKTIGDIIALERETQQWAVFEDKVVYAFELDGKYYRAIAEISPETAEAIWNIDYSDEDYEKKEKDLLAPVEISNIEDLSGRILSEEDRNALVGKTGQELLDSGWTVGSGHNLETMEFWMAYGPFEYTVVFDGKVDEADYETFDDYEDIKDLKVKSVEFLMLGDATSIEE